MADILDGIPFGFILQGFRCFEFLFQGSLWVSLFFLIRAKERNYPNQGRRRNNKTGFYRQIINAGQTRRGGWMNLSWGLINYATSIFFGFLCLSLDAPAFAMIPNFLVGSFYIYKWGEE